ncbi:MAG: hypothetical protein IT367_02025 [Candidatus Hydrogenedentes bacterium]|nr:hypothetical protein [Candidatus Hydrogenedentota bacterium]
MQHEMLPEHLRGTVGDKLYDALAPIMTPSIRNSAAINTIGCYLLCHLTGGEYDVVAGSLVVRQGGAPLGLQADETLVDDDQYYLWIEQRREDGRVELVDFAARCWADWAREEQVLWLGPAPEIVWTYVDELHDTVARYTPHAEITNMVRVALHNAFRSADPPQEVAQWETVINATLDLLAQDARALEYMIARGIAEPAGPSQN